jgi:histidine triad (HIT) family protein
MRVGRRFCLSLFERIGRGQLPAKVVFEDERCQVIQDINPVSPVHLLVYPRERVNRLSDAGPQHEGLLGHLLLVAGQVARQQGLEGYRVVVNVGREGCQTIEHLHLHVVGGRQLRWPPG